MFSLVKNERGKFLGCAFAEFTDSRAASKTVGMYSRKGRAITISLVSDKKPARSIRHLTGSKVVQVISQFADPLPHAKAKGLIPYTDVAPAIQSLQAPLVPPTKPCSPEKQGVIAAASSSSTVMTTINEVNDAFVVVKHCLTCQKLPNYELRAVDHDYHTCWHCESKLCSAH